VDPLCGLVGLRHDRACHLWRDVGRLRAVPAADHQSAQRTGTNSSTLWSAMRTGSSATCPISWTPRQLRPWRCRPWSQGGNSNRSRVLTAPRAVAHSRAGRSGPGHLHHRHRDAARHKTVHRSQDGFKAHLAIEPTPGSSPTAHSPKPTVPTVTTPSWASDYWLARPSLSLNAISSPSQLK
jgi:hypothetical protein